MELVDALDAGKHLCQRVTRQKSMSAILLVNAKVEDLKQSVQFLTLGNNDNNR